MSDGAIRDADPPDSPRGGAPPPGSGRDQPLRRGHRGRGPHAWRAERRRAAERRLGARPPLRHTAAVGGQAPASHNGGLGSGPCVTQRRFGVRPPASHNASTRPSGVCLERFDEAAGRVLAASTSGSRPCSRSGLGRDGADRGELQPAVAHERGARRGARRTRTDEALVNVAQSAAARGARARVRSSCSATVT